MEWIKILLSALAGALITHLLWWLKFQTEKKANYYREALEKLISPFYVWLLYGKIKTKNRNSQWEVPISPEEKEKMIIFSEGEDKEIVEILKKNSHLAAVDDKLFEQIKDFLSCYECNYELKETREKIHGIYLELESIYRKYSKEYKMLIGGI